MNRLFTTLPVALAALAAASTASAGAVAGTYSGNSADGNSVSVVLSTDSNNVLAATSQTVFFSAMCRDGSTLNTGWGYGSDDPVAHNKVSDTTGTNYFTISYHLTFSADGQSATGTIASIGTTLTPVGPKPKKALYCTSPRQSLTLTLQAGAARVAPPAQGAVYLGKLVHSAF